MERARGQGLTILQRGEGLAFRLACPKLEDCACSIYEERFEVCRRFRCGLLERVDAGSVSLEEAERDVSRVRALATRVRAALPAETAADAVLAAVIDLSAGKDAAWRRANAMLLLDAAELVQVCRKRFGVLRGDAVEAPTNAS